MGIFFDQIRVVRRGMRHGFLQVFCIWPAHGMPNCMVPDCCPLPYQKRPAVYHMERCSAKNVGNVWISRKKSSRPYLGPSETIFSMGRKKHNMSKCCLFFFGGPLLLSTRGGGIGKSYCAHNLATSSCSKAAIKARSTLISK